MWCFKTTFRITEGTQKGETYQIWKAHVTAISTEFTYDTETDKHSDTAQLSMSERDQNELHKNV